MQRTMTTTTTKIQTTTTTTKKKTTTGMLEVYSRESVIPELSHRLLRGPRTRSDPALSHVSYYWKCNEVFIIVV